MILGHPYKWCLIATAGWLCACGGAAAPEGQATTSATPPASATAPMSGAAAGAAAAAPAASTSTATPATSSSSSMAAANTAAMPANAMPAQQPPTAAADPNAMSGTMMPADRPDSNCVDRRVSYAKPCSTDPDPCGIASGWPGDEYCLKPPADGEGIQIHVGPKNYKDMAEIAKYVIHPGEEFDNSVIGNIPLTEDKWWDRITVHMRPGSHHWISTVVSGKPEEKFYDDTGCGGAATVGSLGGGQNLIYDNPPGGVPAPENVGLGRSVSGNSSLCMNLHAYNFNEADQIREMWINLYFVDEAKVTQKASNIGMVGGLGLSLDPKQDLTETYQGSFSGDGRIIQLFGHRHVWTPRFAVWLNDKLVYDSWSWQESVTYNYDSLSMNPPIATDMKMDGAVSGILNYKAGDVLKFSCFIENDSDKTLHFSNQLKDGEMCNLWGSTVGPGVSGTFF